MKVAAADENVQRPGAGLIGICHGEMLWVIVG